MYVVSILLIYVSGNKIIFILHVQLRPDKMYEKADAKRTQDSFGVCAALAFKIFASVLYPLGSVFGGSFYAFMREADPFFNARSLYMYI